MAEITQSQITALQEQLLTQARNLALADQRTLSPAVEDAFRTTPRHRFIPRYYDWNSNEWWTVTPETLAQHLPFLYSNNAIGLFGDDNGTPSTISQPSLVLHMLELLQLAPGQRVLEVGAGSGWNAAMMGRLIAPGGHIYSVEIIPEMTEQAAENVAALDLGNVSILQGDGGAGYAPGAPYDRAIFTAGTYDLPAAFHEQLRDDALLLLVLKQAAGGDTLFLLRKTGDHFTSLDAFAVGFVPMTGAHALTDQQPQPLSALPQWTELESQELRRRPFWWGGRGKAHLRLRTHGIRSFLAIVEPWFRTFTIDLVDGGTEEIFGLWDAEGRSLTIAMPDKLVTYGNLATHDRLHTWLRRWIDFGMPAADSFDLRIYPADAPITPSYNEWLIQRNESQFLWRLPEMP